MTKITYDPNTRKVLAIVKASPGALSIPEIVFLASLVCEIPDDEIRRTLRRLEVNEEIRLVDGNKFQPIEGLCQSSSSWELVLAKKRQFESAQTELIDALIAVVSN